MKTQNFKVINISGKKVEIRLVKKGTTTETFPQNVQPQGAVNNSTELSFRMGPSTDVTTYEHFVFAHAGTPNLKNANDYVSNGSAFSIDTSNTTRVLSANLSLTATDSNYTTKKIGLFFKVRASDAEYVLADKIGSSQTLTYQLKGIPSTTNATIQTFTASVGQYFNDGDYYLPLFIGTLQELKSSWLSQSLGITPFYSTGGNLITQNISVSIQVEITGIQITNTATTVTRGDTFTVNTTVTPANVNVAEYTYSASDNTIISFADSHQPSATVIGIGNTTITVSARDNIGNVVQTSKAFVAQSAVERFSATVSANTAGTVIGFDTYSAISTGKLLIDWGDGTTENYQDAVQNRSIRHTYASSGVFNIKMLIDGYFTSIIHDPASTARLTAVTAWGEGEVDQFSFNGAIGLTAVPTTLPSTLTILDEMFLGCSAFNGDISGWNTSNVTSMYRMFEGATVFNRTLNNWNMGKVNTLSYMFKNATSFNQPIDNWDLSYLSIMVGMFQGASSFNQSVANIPVNQVTTLENVFDGASSFNQSLNAWANKLGNIVSLRNFLRNATSFVSGVSNFNTIRIETFESAFEGATKFNDDLSNWNVKYGLFFMNMFKNAAAFNSDLRWWCVKTINSPTGFSTGSGLTAANTPRWGLCPIKETTVTLTGLPSILMVGSTATLGYTIDPTSPIQSVVYTSSNTSVATISGNTLTVLATGSTTITVTVNGLWMGDQLLTATPAITPLRVTTTTTNNRVVGIACVNGNPISVDWGDGNKEVIGTGTQTTHTYTGTVASQIKVSVDGVNTAIGDITVFGAIDKVDNWYGGQINSLKFYQSGSSIAKTKLTSIPTTQPALVSTDYSWMFAECDLFNQDISGWNMSTVTNVEGMFFNAAAFNQPIGKWDVSSITNMAQVLRGATSFNQDLTYWCVSAFTEEPVQFSTDSALIGSNKPVWGTCPNRNLVVTLSTDKPTIGQGLKTRILYSTNPSITVTSEVWSVDDATIASVSTRGLVTAKAIGQTNVRVLLNGVYKAFMKITVTALNVDADTMLLKVTSSGALNVIADVDTLIDWGDGSSEVVLNTAEITHDYVDDGEYLVQLSPSAKVTNMQLSGNYAQVVQWSSLGYSRLQLGKSGVVTKLTDIPTLQPALLTNYNKLCAYLPYFNDDLSQWDVSAVTDFSQMFEGSPLFNSDITEWDVSAAVNMDKMLLSATAFNRDLSWWCVSAIASEPTDFSTNSGLIAENKPVWGTCPVRQYSMTIDDADIVVGGTTQLGFTLTPATTVRSVVWETSNLDVLSIDAAGNATGGSEGTVTVTVTVNKVYVATKVFTVNINVVLNAPENVSIQYVEAPTNVSASLNTLTIDCTSATNESGAFDFNGTFDVYIDDMDTPVLSNVTAQQIVEVYGNGLNDVDVDSVT